MKSKSWFEVSKEGLRELQEGKPKHFIARELIQNAWDEQIKTCSFDAYLDRGEARIEVVDDNPQGFKDLSDAFTLFKSTSKRSDPSKRGRFNIGEKQVLSLCKRATITTTKGTVIFDENGRSTKRATTEKGSKVQIVVRMNQAEFDEMLEVVKNYLVPKDINFLVNGKNVAYRTPYKVIRTKLLTENEANGMFLRAHRITDVHILKPIGKSYLYEMGLPVTEIDCQFDVDVQQKVPLSIDRDTVPASYLKDLFAEVLNVTYEDVEKEGSSEVWIRQAMEDSRINPDAVKQIVTKRFGDKVVIANTFDPISIDDALSNGYNVVHGSEMSKEEWENIKKSEAMKTSSDLFGRGFAPSTPYDPNDDMVRVGNLAKKIALRVLKIKLQVRFIKSPGASASATFEGETLTFNVSHLSKGFFANPKSAGTLDLIVHELGHYGGHHTESGYHQTLTKLAGELIVIALEEPDFFEV